MAAESKKYDYSNNGKEYGKSSSYANDEFNKVYIKEEFAKEKVAVKSEAASWKHDKFESLERGESSSPDPRKHRDSHTRR